ncbi:MAG: Ig-like domain-containing protein, partial [Armatimonadetes bacterium]|nr:Ig-like domain-containing protein [Candidatus Hippobium faecium]
MKKISFFTLILMLVACVFANAQTVSEKLEAKAFENLFGSGAYTVGSDGPRTINVSYDSPNIGDIETDETVKVLVTLETPAENWEVLEEPTLAEISYSGIWSQYVFEITLVAGNIVGNDTFKLIGDGLVELTFNVAEPKKDFTVTANDEEIDPAEPLNLNEFSGNGFAMQVYDDQGGLIKTTQYTLQNFETIEENLVIGKQKQLDYVNIWKVSGEGKAKVTLSKDGYKDFVFYVTYTEPKKDAVKIFDGEMDVTGKTINMSVIDFGTFISKVEGEGLSQTVTWSTSDWNTVRIFSNGTYNAKKYGTAVITCTSIDNPDVFATVTINVVPGDVTVSIEGDSEITMNKGDEQTLIAKVLPETESQYVSWTSDNWNVVSVVSGKITAKKVGTATITATFIADPSKSASVVVNVINPESVQIFDGDMDVTGQTLEMNVLDFGTFTAKVKGEGEGLSQKVTWSTSDWNTVRILSNGAYNAKKYGTVVITCASKDKPDVFATVTINVVPGDVTVSIEGDSEITMHKGDEQKLIAKVMPETESQYVS